MKSNVQVYNDGGQFELDPHYHLAAINIFCKALNIADLNGFRNEFPAGVPGYNRENDCILCQRFFPRLHQPVFQRCQNDQKKEMLKNYRNWSKMFPKNQFIKYLATDGKEGALPEYLSKGFLKSGFFVFRNSWGTDATQMVVKAGRKHSGTVNRITVLSNSGSTAKPVPRFRFLCICRRRRSDGTTQLAPSDLRTQHRNAEQQNLDQTESVTKLAAGRQRTDIGYRKSELQEPETPPFRILRRQQLLRNCRRNGGSQKGSVNLHYQMPKGEIANSREDMTFVTQFEEGSNMKLAMLRPRRHDDEKEPGWCSTAYRKRYKRMNVSFNVKKDSEDARTLHHRYLSDKEQRRCPKLSAKFKNKTFNENGLEVEVKVNGKKQSLNYKL